MRDETSLQLVALIIAKPGVHGGQAYCEEFFLCNLCGKWLGVL
jgi:hypothetical protein